MKKAISIILVLVTLVTAFSLIGCNTNAEDEEKEPSDVADIGIYLISLKPTLNFTTFT